MTTKDAGDLSAIPTIQRVSDTTAPKRADNNLSTPSHLSLFFSVSSNDTGSTTENHQNPQNIRLAGSPASQGLLVSLTEKGFQNYVREHAVSVMEFSIDPDNEGGGEEAYAEFESTRYQALKYKKVANRVKPVSAALPETFRIHRYQPEDVLQDMPRMPTSPGEFVEGQRYTRERMEQMKIGADGFLTQEEIKLIHWFFLTCEFAFAWDESEKGIFSHDYFPPVKIPTLAHDVWIFKNIPIPRGLYPKIIEIIKAKQASGVIEPSNAAYRSQWFWVLKKDGKSLRIVHNLQPLNAVTIKDSAVPPIVEPYAETFARRACYSVLDLFVGFDQRELHPDSRDLTTFQTPLGTFRLTRIPMGYTNSQQVQHGDLCFLLQDEIPEITMPFVDDVPIRGPASRYERGDGGYETIAENAGIRRFVWEHVRDVLRVVWRVGKAGGTFSGPKAFICVKEAVIVGHLCTYEGRRPEPGRLQKVLDWPVPRDLTQVRGFLGVMGTLRMFVKDFAAVAEPLVKLTRKRAAGEFVFGREEQEAMDQLKERARTCPAIRPIDYESDGEVVLAVDSSHIAAGYVLSQEGEDAQRYPSRFGSITWNETERRYSQSKLELFGLFRSLRDVRTYIIAVRKLVVEVDARYIKGMINNPDVQPNATINRWIAGILLFDFELRHISAKDHTAADGLSRRETQASDPDQEGDYDEWIDSANGFAIEVANWDRRVIRTDDEQGTAQQGTRVPIHGLMHCARMYTSTVPDARRDNEGAGVLPPQTDDYAKQDENLRRIEDFLSCMRQPENMKDQDLARFIRYASTFFILKGKLFRRNRKGEHQLVVARSKRGNILRQAHEDSGHKGVYSVTATLQRRFWWPGMKDDVKWWGRTCHECQVRSTERIRLTPTVPAPFALFRKFYVDTMFLPTAHGFIGLVHARCSLSSYPEWRMIRAENARSIATFLFEDSICRYGAVEEIVTDNGAPYRAALDYLKTKYGIHNVRISPYNSQANGPVERRHYDVREALMKATMGRPQDWPLVAHSVLWAERVSIQKSTGYSPYYIAHGIEPILPFDLAEATMLAQPVHGRMSTTELIAARAVQLQRRQEDLDIVKGALLKARIASAQQFEEKYRASIRAQDITPGTLVLVRNSKFDSSIGAKAKARYHGPMVVVRKTEGGSFVLAELDGAVSKLRYAAYRVLPYHVRDVRKVPVSTITDLEEHEIDLMTRDREPTTAC